MKLPSLVRYALSDLRHRPVATSLNVAAVALAAGYILVLGFYGASIHRYQGELLERRLALGASLGLARGPAAWTLLPHVGITRQQETEDLLQALLKGRILDGHDHLHALVEVAVAENQ